MRKEIDLTQNLSFKTELKTIDEESKKVSFILSNESVVDRGPFKIKLLHGKENISLKRAKILKVFYNHRSDSLPIGKWENVRIENKKLKADAVFDKNDEFAMKVFQKIKDGFLESVSVGISILEFEEDSKNKDLIIVTKWELLEASIVNIPAIPTAKVGLNREVESLIREKNSEGENLTATELKEKYPKLYQELLELGAKREQNRLKEVFKIVKFELFNELEDEIFNKENTSERIELLQYRLMEKKRAKKFKEKRESIDSDALSLGEQVLEMGLSESNESNKEAKEKEEFERMKEVMLSAVRRRVDE